MTVAWPLAAVSRPVRLLATDLDGTLVGDSGMRVTLQHHLATLRPRTALVYVTGRSLVSTLRLIEAIGLLVPDRIVAGVGTAIHGGPEWQVDATWQHRLADGWQERRVRETAGCFADLRHQSPGEQTPLKCSYTLAAARAPAVLARLRAALAEAGLRARVIYSGGRDLDIVPVGAGKAAAVGYLGEHWGIAWSDVLVCGDSGNDRDMLSLPAQAVVVGNACDNLLQAPPAGAFVAGGRDAAGMLEGLQHFGWLAGG
jgi:sucrose-6F-phosphate phosphohydrolase